MTPSSNPSPPRLSVVTGAAGFIGSHLVEALLARGDRVRALVHYNALGHRGHLEDAIRTPPGRERLEIVLGDVQDARCMNELVRGADVVFHLAALIGIPYSYVAPHSYVHVNILGTLHILEACREQGVARLLHTSTSETLGTARFTPQDETHPLQGQSPYAATKIAADKLVESYHLSFGLPAVVVRPFNTYGPRQSARAVIPTILAQALAPDRGEIRLGSLHPVRDLTYVADTAAAYVRLAEAPVERVAGRLFHLGTGEGVTIGDLARLALEVVGCDKPIRAEAERVRPEASEVLALLSDNRRVRETTGWTPTVSLRDGLRRTADWMRAHPELYRPEEYAR